MYVLIIDIKVKPAHVPDAEKTYRGTFRPAISSQPGFVSVEFLKPQDEGDHVLIIAFESPSVQQAWVATDLHTRLWSQMEANFDSYNVRTFSAI
ncbi:MAG TPA: antibiotic biosynthesis monooxygenase family protein [Rhizomicrobium sp.]|nr:antibiotic biosynthesis monooxygenase family protein [Rhizomicrobium sp.]